MRFLSRLLYVVSAKYETGFINFYADWCQFSRKLAPEFDQAADELAVQYADQPNKVIMAKVDCDAESKIDPMVTEG